MANRTTAAKVKAIVDTVLEEAAITPFIDAANQLVTELCANAVPATGYDATRLEMIETWLSAHFVAIRDPSTGYASETIGAASMSTGRQMGLNLAQTVYGQQARLLDTKGGLAWIDQHISQGKRSKAGITWIGTDQRDLRAAYQQPWLYRNLMGW